MGGSSPLPLPAGSVLFMISQNICSVSRQKKSSCRCLLSKNNLFNLTPVKTSPKRESPGYIAMGLVISCMKLMSHLLFALMMWDQGPTVSHSLQIIPYSNNCQETCFFLLVPAERHLCQDKRAISKPSIY